MNNGAISWKRWKLCLFITVQILLSNTILKLSCPFGDKIKSEKYKYKVDSNIGNDYLLLISTIHYFVMLLLYMEFDESQGQTSTQWIMER